MSDPIAEAAAQMSDAAPSSSEPFVTQEVGTPAVGESLQSSPASTTSTTPEPSSADLPNVDAATPPAGAATPASTGNVLVNAAPVVDAGNVFGAVQTATAPTADFSSLDGTSASTAPIATTQTTSEPLPRESHLMLLEAKITSFRAKLANAERVALDEFEAIVGHIKAVLQ